ncbi:HK97 family phage prohead protease [Bradyrhizobium sp. USDA 4454]
MTDTRRAPLGVIEHRFADVKASSYDAEARTVEAILSVGAEVKRGYGVERLEISRAAVDLGRVTGPGVPLIDSHNVLGIDNVLGRLAKAWFQGEALMGLIEFDDSDAGRKAEGMVSRGTVRGISIGYWVDQWEVTDEDGNIIDPERERLVWDEDYLFTAKRWELLEVSLVSVPADPAAFVRSVRIANPVVAAIKARMEARQRIATGTSQDLAGDRAIAGIADWARLANTTGEIAPRVSRRRFPRKPIWRGI